MKVTNQIGFMIMHSLWKLMVSAQALELMALGDKTSQMEGQVTVVLDLKAELEAVKKENEGKNVT